CLRRAPLSSSTSPCSSRSSHSTRCSRSPGSRTSWTSEPPGTVGRCYIRMEA
ncbi:MAG: hypothetical protein AVDCRST_MAG68-1249, partial [uncultured Gemmatimonadetes bacterium]